MPHARNIIIIGGGPAGLTAAIYAARASLQPLVFAGAMPGGQLMLTSEVENYPGFADPIMGPELMERWRAQAKRYGAEIVDDDVTALDASARPFTVTAGNRTEQAHAVIVASGARAKWLGVTNEQRLVGKGVHTCAQCDGFAYAGKHVVVVGGGDTAMEETLTLAKIAARITIVHRRDAFRASKIMADRVQANPKITIRWNTVVTNVHGDQRVNGVRLQSVLSPSESDGSPLASAAGGVRGGAHSDAHGEINPPASPRGTQRSDGGRGRGWTATKQSSSPGATNVKTEDFPCDGLFVAIGYTPNTDFLRGVIELRDNGYVAVRDHTHSNVAGIFVAGDVEDFRYRQAVTAAGGGCAAAIDAERWLAEQGSSV